MRLLPQSMRSIDDGILIEGPEGAVLLRRQADKIAVEYKGSALVNGTALAYSKEIFEQAIELTNQFPFAWIIEADGTQRITDHQRFYEQTFNPDLQGIETLKRWMHHSSA